MGVHENVGTDTAVSPSVGVKGVMVSSHPRVNCHTSDHAPRLPAASFAATRQKYEPSSSARTGVKVAALVVWSRLLLFVKSPFGLIWTSYVAAPATAVQRMVRSVSEVAVVFSGASRDGATS